LGKNLIIFIFIFVSIFNRGEHGHGKEASFLEFRGKVFEDVTANFSAFRLEFSLVVSDEF